MFRKQGVALLAVIGLAAAILPPNWLVLEGAEDKGDDPPLPKGAILRLGKSQHQRRNLGSPSVTFLPNGTLASTRSDGKLVFWNARTGKAIRTLEGHPFVVFSPNGKIMASHPGGRADAVRVLQVDTGKEIACTSPIWHYLFHREFCFSKDARYLFVGGGTENNRKKSNPALCVWDLATCKKTTEFPLREILQCIIVSPDGKWLATSTYGRYNLQIWDTTNHKETQRFFSDGASQISGIAFSPDSSSLASVGHFPAVRLSHVATGKDRWKISTLDNWAFCVAFSPQGRMMAVGTGKPQGNIYLLETATGLVRSRFEYGGKKNVGLVSIAFSPDGSLLASAASDCALLLWDVTGGILAKAPIKPIDAKELEGRWAELANVDGAKAWQAIQALEARPEQAVAIIKERLIPNTKLDAKRLSQLQSDLNHDSFQVREKASNQFEVLGAVAEPSLRKILASNPPLEARKRVTKLLEKIAKRGLLSEELRALRAHEILESIATPEAQRLLQAAADGEPAARVTQDARASLERMGNRKNNE
jgi:WD40 repeat protein